MIAMTKNLDVKALCSTVSMFVWGLVLAKAKTGFSAALSKDKEAVGSSYKRFISIIALVGVASVVKLNADYSYVENFLAPGASPLKNSAVSSSPILIGQD